MDRRDRHLGFRKPKKAIGLDIGTHAVKVVLMSRSRGRLNIEQAGFSRVDRNQYENDPVLAQTLAILDATSKIQTKNALVVASLPGQTVVVRYPRLIDIPRDQLESTIATEAANNIPYDLNDVFMDWSVLEKYQEDNREVTKILIVAAMREVIRARLKLLSNAGVTCGIIGVDSLALSDGAEACNLYTKTESVAIIDIGLSSSTVHFVKNGISNFIRDVNWGSRELIQAVTKALHCSQEEAMNLIEQFEPPETSADWEGSATMVNTDTGEVPLAELPGTGDFSGSLLDPLDEEDAFAMPESSIPVAMEHQREIQIQEAVTGPLNRFAIELRRSFDYYEHQLYEHPVDRILLSGGLARFPLLANALEEELGFGVIDIASPVNSAVHVPATATVQQLLNHPAQFMVAVGLATRGMVDL
jgi:type IV pilus assembly protein PilM